MDMSAIPYLCISKAIELGGGVERQVFVSICLLEPLLTGVGHSRDTAIADMCAQISEKYGDEGWREAVATKLS